jgi:hypothetical protein
VLVGTSEEKRPMGSATHKWEDNIKLDIQTIGWNVWTGTSFVNMLINLSVPHKALNILTSS